MIAKERLSELIAQGESLTVEFKGEGGGQIPDEEELMMGFIRIGVPEVYRIRGGKIGS